MRESFDEPESDYDEEPGFPMTVMAAGIFWIVLGAVLVLGLLVALAGAFFVAQGRQEKGEVVFGGLCMGLFIRVNWGAPLFSWARKPFWEAREIRSAMG